MSFKSDSLASPLPLRQSDLSSAKVHFTPGPVSGLVPCPSHGSHSSPPKVRQPPRVTAAQTSGSAHDRGLFSGTATTLPSPLLPPQPQPLPLLLAATTSWTGSGPTIPLCCLSYSLSHHPTSILAAIRRSSRSSSSGLHPTLQRLSIEILNQRFGTTTNNARQLPRRPFSCLLVHAHPALDRLKTGPYQSAANPPIPPPATARAPYAIVCRSLGQR